MRLFEEVEKERKVEHFLSFLALELIIRIVLNNKIKLENIAVDEGRKSLKRSVKSRKGERAAREVPS